MKVSVNYKKIPVPDDCIFFSKVELKVAIAGWLTSPEVGRKIEFNPDRIEVYSKDGMPMKQYGYGQLAKLITDHIMKTLDVRDVKVTMTYKKKVIKMDGKTSKTRAVE